MMLVSMLFGGNHIAIAKRFWSDVFGFSLCIAIIDTLKACICIDDFRFNELQGECYLARYNRSSL